MNISLTKHFDDFIEEQVRSGRYSNASEVIRAALRLLEDENRLSDARVQAAIDRGLAELDAGKGRPFDAERIKREGRKRLAAKKKSSSRQALKLT